MPKPIILEVPYSEKDQAKALGAKWNPKMKKLYVPVGKDINPFRKWNPNEHSKNKVKALPPIYIIESTTSCWKCNNLITIITLASQGFTDDSGPITDELLIYNQIQEMPTQIQHLISRRYPTYFKDYSKTTHSKHFMNHCTCGAKQGDFHLHSEPGAPFFPTEPEDCKGTTVIELINLKEIILKASFSMSSVDYILDYSKREQIKMT